MATVTAPDQAASPSTSFTLGSLAYAGTASLGAGAIHAAAIGVHQDHAAASRTFAVLALLQLAWGAAALVGGRRILAAVGAAISGGALVGWVLAKTSGISFVSGLEEAEGIQLTDGLAAALAAVSLVICLRALLTGSARRLAPGVALQGLAAVVAAVSLVGMVEAGSHSHAGGHGGGHEAAAGDDHGHDEGGDDHAEGEDHGDDHGDAEPAAVPTRPYDPDKPLDFSGVEGVSEEQQARAENMVAITLARLPKFADHQVAEAEGYHSIGDGLTGHEHFINWNYINDDQVLNPDVPESLVYERGEDGSRKLVSAMFMMPQGNTLDDVPDLGGPLTQWHIHDNLCFSDDPVSPRVAGVTKVGGECRPPTTKLDPVPMIHVWITPHPCGPFAALEGVAAGQVKPGEEHLCNHAHGA